MTSKHILVALLEDKPGVLNRMSSVFRRRGFNIENVNVIDTINLGDSSLTNLTRVTIVVSGSKAMVTQLKRQLEKIIDVVKVSEIPAEGEA
ncbi:MAG: acetolactate synthase small subunit [Dehalococcoidales bacterium]|jgi:acetolactate synthase-1/3 small subunit|nr:acetolactate synthase small subunit [Dehalococcoidales bacterium]